MLNNLLDPMREKRAYYENHMDEVKEIIVEGTRKANKIGNENLDAIKEKMFLKI